MSQITQDRIDAIAGAFNALHDEHQIVTQLLKRRLFRWLFPGIGRKLQSALSDSDRAIGAIKSVMERDR